MRLMENLCSDIPAGLRTADETLTRYGRWAADRQRMHRCGSAEGHYRPPGGEALEQRRETRQIGMPVDEAMACQRALARVADRERLVLVVLYIPRRIPAEVQFRMLRIPARAARERHLVGLRMFDNLLRIGRMGANLALHRISECDRVPVT